MDDRYDLHLCKKGALAADGMEATAEHIDFRKKSGRRFRMTRNNTSGTGNCGMVFAQPQIAIEVTELLVKVHLRHFGGEKILMLMDPGEREDAFSVMMAAQWQN